MNLNYIFKAYPTDYPEIMDVWEASVRATHDFLKEEDLQFFKSIIPTEFLPAIDVYYICNEFNRMVAFMGIHEKHLEMLFIDPTEQGKGLGKNMIAFAINILDISYVDVNEQNQQAVGFYKKMGFITISRDKTDGNGKPYPILHMQLSQTFPKKDCTLKQVEDHPLGFYLPVNTHILMLGSFPPARTRWSMNFYYPNFINDMWRIMGIIFFNDKNYFLIPTKKAFDEQKARSFCDKYGIGIGDTAEKIVRLKDNASDKFLEVIKPMDAKQVLSQIPDCKAIIITGQKAMETILTVLPAKEPAVGEWSSFTFLNRDFKLYRMPSSSRAYPKPLEEKAAIYRKMFEDVGLL